MPYSKNAVENAPSRKYLRAPSADRSLRRLSPASAYTEIDINSTPRNTIMRSRAAASSIMPLVANRISTCVSAVVVPTRSLSSMPRANAPMVPSRMMMSAIQRKLSTANRARRTPSAAAHHDPPPR
jgi:hypothetical protein